MTQAMLALTSLLQTGQYHTSGPGLDSMPAISSRIPSTDAGVGYSTRQKMMIFDDDDDDEWCVSMDGNPWFPYGK